jgi:hypothetical protein
MKKCPVCNSAYNDPTLNYCPEDGATLIAQTGSFGQPQGFTGQPQFSSQKKRNPVLWILGITGGIIIIGIIGIVGLIALLAHSVGNNNNNGNLLSNTVTNSNRGIYPVKLKVSNTSGSSVAKDNGNIDFARWGERKTAMGETKLVGDEFQVSAAQSGYYYVVISSSKFDDRYLTNDAIAKVTTHSVTGDSPSLGYGLIVNSDVDPLKSDYAFLIRSDNQTFRVVRHQNNKEETITDWTTASQIRTGTQTNQLEVHSIDDKLSFYINGKLATSLTDKNNTDEGLVGLYTSDTTPIGFSALQIIKN